MAQYADLRVRAERRAKMAVHSMLLRRNLRLMRHPPERRLVDLMAAAGTRLVLDVGANGGQFGAQLRSAGYRGPIWSFEPLSDAFAALQAVAQRESSWRAVRTALGASHGSMQINRAGNSYSSSLLPMTATHESAAPESRVVGTEQVEIDTLDAVVEGNQIDVTDALLKIDTQGYERAVLDGAVSTLPSCALLKVELSFVELYEGQSLYLDVITYLLERGFVMCGVEEGFVDRATGQMLQFDAIFVRADVQARLSPGAGPR